MGLPLQSFSSIQGMDTRPAIYKKTPPRRFEMYQIMFKPNSQFSGNFSTNKFILNVWWIKPFMSGLPPHPIEHWASTRRPHCLLRPKNCEHLMKITSFEKNLEKLQKGFNTFGSFVGQVSFKRKLSIKISSGFLCGNQFTETLHSSQQTALSYDFKFSV